MSCFDRAVELAPGDDSSWGNRSITLTTLGRHEEALGCYERASELDPHDAGLWTHRGRALAELGRDDEALTCYGRGLEIAPEDGQLWALKGWTLGKLGRADESLPCLERALEIAPDVSGIWEAKGLPLRESGRNEEALASFERALAINPQDVDLWEHVSAVLGALGRWDESAASCDRGLEIDPRDVELWNNKAVALAFQYRYEEAVACYDRALEVAPTEGRLWRAKGVVLHGALGRPEEALACFEEGLKHYPDDAELLQMRNAVLGNVSGPGRTPDGSAPPRSAEGGAPPDGGPRSADSAEQPVWEYRDLILPLEIPLSTETPRGYELTKRRYEQIVVPQLEEVRKDGWETLEPADFEATMRANRLDHSRLPDDPLDDPAVIHSVLVRLARLVRGAVPRDRDSGRWERRVISVPLGVEFRGREEDLPAWYRECEGLILRELQAAGKDGWAPEHRTDLPSLVDNDRVAGDFPLLVSATISLKRPLAAGDASGPSAAPDQATSDAQGTLSSSTDRVRQLLTEAEQAGWERPEAVEELLARAFAGDPLVEAHSTAGNVSLRQTSPLRSRTNRNLASGSTPAQRTCPL